MKKVQPGTTTTLTKQGKALIRLAEAAFRLGLLHGFTRNKPLSSYELVEEIAASKHIPEKSVPWLRSRLRRVYGAGFNIADDERKRHG
jgi:hypothetical protein